MRDAPSVTHTVENMSTKSVDDTKQWLEASKATRCIVGLCLLVVCAVASLAKCLWPIVLLDAVRDIAMPVGIIVYALIVVENMVTTSVGGTRQWLDASRAARSFAGLCLFVFFAVAYCAADHGVQHGEIAGPAGLPNAVLRDIALAVGAAVYALIVVDFFRWRHLSLRS